MPAGLVHVKKSRFDVYIGRPSIFGNPYEIGKDGTRDEVIEKYREWIQTQPLIIAHAKRYLRGRILGCWCAPNLRCHGEVLIEIANAQDQSQTVAS